VVCSSTSWGIREQLEICDCIVVYIYSFIDLPSNEHVHRPTRFFSIAANWGNGGWLKVHDVDDSIYLGDGYQAEHKYMAAYFAWIPLGTTVEYALSCLNVERRVKGYGKYQSHDIQSKTSFPCSKAIINVAYAS